MTKEPELPNFVRDLEILQSLDRLETPLEDYAVESVETEPVSDIEKGLEGMTS